MKCYVRFKNLDILFVSLLLQSVSRILAHGMYLVHMCYMNEFMVCNLPSRVIKPISTAFNYKGFKSNLSQIGSSYLNTYLCTNT